MQISSHHPFFDCHSRTEWVQEIKRLQSALKDRYGIDQVRVGIEIEFATIPQKENMPIWLTAQFTK